MGRHVIDKCHTRVNINTGEKLIIEMQMEIIVVIFEDCNSSKKTKKTKKRKKERKEMKE